MKNGFRFRFFYENNPRSKCAGPVVVKCEQDSTASDVVEAFKSFMLACGYAEESIKGAFREAAEEE